MPRPIVWIKDDGELLVRCPNCMRTIHSIGNLVRCCNSECNKWGCIHCFEDYGSEGAVICEKCKEDRSFCSIEEILLTPRTGVKHEQGTN